MMMLLLSITNNEIKLQIEQISQCIKLRLFYSFDIILQLSKEQELPHLQQGLQHQYSGNTPFFAISSRKGRAMLASPVLQCPVPSMTQTAAPG